ncbi:hypothetical protein [Leptospira haakeii]|uniref:hypothetical protein n=1 Tax=Leptospira haakeii TaxID=2023198 RepID=UPI0013FD1175
MKIIFVARISIDSSGRVLVKPSNANLSLIYREAMEVGWENFSLVAPPNPVRAPLALSEWWFARILAACREVNCLLFLTPATRFSGFQLNSLYKLLLAYLAALLPFFSWLSPNTITAKYR